jgi:hypothetical protein
MADETRINFLYPPNFPGTYDDTPDAENVKGTRRYIVQCQNYSDGTGEDDAIKVKRTDLRTPGGNIPSKLIVEKISFHVEGMTVRIAYNNRNDQEVALLKDEAGKMDFTPHGGFVPESDDDTADDYAGDIVITTANESSGDSYDITMSERITED